jgi:hypothetical protein
MNKNQKSSTSAAEINNGGTLMSRVTEGQLISKEAQMRLIEGARKGGKAPKHFTPETKERQKNGARKGGAAPKHFTAETKARQIEGSRLGGRHSHVRDGGYS